MGTGIDAARAAAPEHAQAMENFRDQLIIVLVARLEKLSGPVEIPIAEVDDTGHLVLSLAVRDGKFLLKTGAKP